MAKYGTFKYGTTKYGSSGDEDSALYVFDRTSADLINNTSKAYINYYDLNRIESRMQELMVLMNELGYPVDIVTKTDWIRQTSIDDSSIFPLLKEIQRIYNNEKLLLSKIFVYDTTPKMPTNFENLTIYNVNNMEKILYDLNLIIKSLQKTAIYCGYVECGEVI